jgi:hypothetical protein
VTIGLRLANGNKSDVTQALALAPADTTDFAFTDWALIKQYKGAQNLTSKSDLQTRVHFAISTNQDQAVASAYDLSFFTQQADTWSWDSTDLVWESTISAQSAPVYVLKFRDDFDFAPVIAHFQQRGFTKGTYRGATVYSHPFDLTVDWLLELGVFNTAMLPDQHIFVLSSALAGVHAALDAYNGAAKSLADDAGFSAVAAQMGAVAALEMTTSSVLCSAIGVTPRGPNPAVQQQLAAAGTLHSYAVLGVGYLDESSQPVGLIVLHYTASGDAQADVTPRGKLARDGTSIATNNPYSQDVFTLDSATANGSDLLLRVHPVNAMPLRLFTMYYDRDLLFAAYPQ